MPPFGQPCPQGFSLKGWSRPTHFLREKPWGQGYPFGFFTHLYPVVFPLLKNCCAGPDWGILFTCHLYKAIDEKIMVTAVLMMDSKVARLVLLFCCCCCCVFFFQGQYLPSLNTSCLATNKDMEKRLPQLYYTKMKNCCKQCYMLTWAPVHDCGKNSRCREIPLQGK